MTYLEALGITAAAIAVVGAILFYFNLAFTWAGDPHNYVKRGYRMRRYIGWAMVYVGVVVIFATLLFFTYEV